MDRRKALRQTALISGAAIASPLYSSLLTGCTRKPVPEELFTPVVFSQEQYALLSAISDTLLPATDTPSATETGAVQMIDSIVGECYTDEQKSSYMGLYGELEDALDGFSDTDPQDRIIALMKLESASGPLFDAWMHVKQQIIAMYLTSETVGENQLNYLPVPGVYEPCIPLSETNGKAWSI